MELAIAVLSGRQSCGNGIVSDASRGLILVALVINQKFFISGFTSLLHKAPNMDTLVALGSGASFAYSTYALFSMTGAQMRMDMDAVMHYMDEFYFESARHDPDFDHSGKNAGTHILREKRPMH